MSLVLHPRNPYAPTVHMNVRFFVARKPAQQPVWWFGGGMDLTPYYGFEEDAVHFHRTCRAALAPFGADLHPRSRSGATSISTSSTATSRAASAASSSTTCREPDFERCFASTRSVGDHFLDAYVPIVERRKDMPYGERERDFQAYRRGRYVEFNLVCDRGTLFGLQSGGRTESILMSLPPLREVALRLEARARHPRSVALHGFPHRQGLGVTALRCWRAARFCGTLSAIANAA